MTEPRTLVRWPRKGRKGFTLWHMVTPILNDTEGRTGCGKSWPRRDAEVVPTVGTDGLECANCRRALSGTVPGVPA